MGGEPNAAEGRPTFFRVAGRMAGGSIDGREEPLPAAFNLCLNIAYILRIIQHEICEAAFLLDRLLGGFTASQLRRRPAPS